jgi:TonB-dependent starch-binding outer membrane protein SusC
MKKLLLTCLLASVCCAHLALAQERTISGRVTSAEDGSSLPGVNVVLKGTTAGVVTDADGSYTISTPSSGGTLVFSFIGLRTEEIEIGSRSIIDLQMTIDVTQLTEVVVTGYSTQTKREVTGAISSVKGSVIENLPMQSFDRAIQGRAAGVQVMSGGGQPGGGITVNIRGTGTINGSTQPLYIVDGVQVSGGGITGVTTSNALTSINPADIESIEILKDAAAASIYGALAGNGVVIITTKKGKSGKTKIKASAQYGVSELYNPYDIVSSPEWLQLRAEAYANVAKRQGYSYWTGSDALDTDAASTVAGYSDIVTRYERTFGDQDSSTPLPTYDWVNSIVRQGKVAQYDLSASGGDDKTNFFISGSYSGNEGTIYGSSFNRGTVRANITHKISEYVSLETNLGLTGSKTKGFSTNAGFFVNTPFTGGLFMSPIVPIYNADGTYNNTLLGNSFNMVQLLNEELREAGTFQTVSNLAFNVDIMKGLKFRAFAGIDFSDIKDYNYRPASIPAYIPGTGSETFRRNLSWNTNYTLNYNKKLNDIHNVSALVGFEYRNNSNTTLGANAQTFPSPRLTLLSSGATPTAATSTYTGYKLAGYFANLKYDFKDKYLASLTARYDGSSRFGANQRFGLFYGASAGWRLSAENFMSGAGFVSDLKIRASYGVVGVQPTNDFQSLDLYGSGGQYNNLGGVRPAQLGNAELTWEQAATIDLGLDFSLFNNRIYGALDFWRRNNTDLLLPETLPSDSGFGSIQVNLGEVENRGIDFEISSVNLEKSGFKWVTTFNISLQENEIIDLGPGVDRIGNTYIVGKPLGMLYTRTWAGVNPADGRPMYYDKNGNITYNPTTDDQKYQGSTIPSHYGGFTNTLSYKNLSLEVFFQYQYGNESYIQAGQYLESYGIGDQNYATSQMRRWTTPGQITDTPKPDVNAAETGGYSAQNLTSKYIQTASYIRLKQVTLSYQLPFNWVSKLKMSSANLFVQGINLATFTNFRGDDPENAIGNNLNQYPNPKQITAGVTIEF